MAVQYWISKSCTGQIYSFPNAAMSAASLIFQNRKLQLPSTTWKVSNSFLVTNDAGIVAFLLDPDSALTSLASKSLWQLLLTIHRLP